MFNFLKRRNKKLPEKIINEIRLKSDTALTQTRNAFSFAEDLQNKALRQMYRRQSNMNNGELNQKKKELVESIVMRSGDVVLLHEFLKHNQDVGRRYEAFLDQVFPPLREDETKEKGTDDEQNGK